MYKQVYQDYKYCMQDIAQLYIGAKYSMEEITGNEEIPFKFRLIVERYIYEDTDPETTLESLLYYLTDKGLLYKILRQIKARVKFNVLEEKRSPQDEAKQRYTTRTASVEEFVRMTPPEKERKGVVIQELAVSKLALMGF